MLGHIHLCGRGIELNVHTQFKSQRVYYVCCDDLIWASWKVFFVSHLYSAGPPYLLDLFFYGFFSRVLIIVESRGIVPKFDSLLCDPTPTPTPNYFNQNSCLSERLPYMSSGHVFFNKPPLGLLKPHNGTKVHLNWVDCGDLARSQSHKTIAFFPRGPPGPASVEWDEQG